jgi:DNA transposition AAA+ family ATPase
MKLPDDLAPLTGNSNAPRKYRWSDDKVNQALLHRSEEDRDRVFWLHYWMRANDCTPEEVAKRLTKKNGQTYSGNTIRQVLGGSFQGELHTFTEAIESFRASQEAQPAGQSPSTVLRAPFIETDLSRQMFRICDASVTYGLPVFIIGATRIGKTRSLEAYCASKPPGRVIYVEMPAEGHIGNFLVALAEVLGIPTSLSTREHRRRIKNAFRSDMLLIVDQAHEELENENSRRRPSSLKFIMELFNHAKCGVVLAGTDVLEHGFTKGPHAKILDQLAQRRLATLTLPAKPDAASLDQFAAYYGLAPAKGAERLLQDKVIRELNLGRWLILLLAAHYSASKAGSPMTWDHVFAARDEIRCLEAKKADAPALMEGEVLK